MKWKQKKIFFREIEMFSIILGIFNLHTTHCQLLEIVIKFV